MKYAIDGSNVLLGLRLNKKPSPPLFARLIHALIARRANFRVFFDNSIERTLAAEGLSSEWNTLKAAFAGAKIVPTFAPRADTHIEAYCNNEGAAVINAGDKMDSWNTRPSTVHRARLQRNRNALQLALVGTNSQFIFSVPLHTPFELGGIGFPVLNSSPTAVEPLIAPDSQYTANTSEGTLLVLALDASGSMAERKSFDGRPKHAHLNDIVKQTITRLRNSSIADGLYVAILRFENDVTALPGPGGALFSSVHDWFAKLSEFDYLKGVTLGQTNIRLALQRTKELIQDTLADEDSMNQLADAWRASVVLITDGNHFVQRSDGTQETDNDVARQAFQIHEGMPHLLQGRLDIGCVGIGSDVNHNLLRNIASQCTPTQKRIASVIGLSNFLQDNRLFITVDSKDPKFGEAIRAFIDVASGSA